MNGYVATTDGDWFRFLSDQEQVDEVNFWQPNPWGGSFGVLRRGEPLFFKLKAPDNAIAGLGFFERYSELPLSLAWDAFGIKNGAASSRPCVNGSCVCADATSRGTRTSSSAASCYPSPCSGPGISGSRSRPTGARRSCVARRTT